MTHMHERDRQHGLIMDRTTQHTITHHTHETIGHYTNTPLEITHYTFRGYTITHHTHETIRDIT